MSSRDDVPSGNIEEQLIEMNAREKLHASIVKQCPHIYFDPW
jgi:hypothetical protein